MPISLPAEPRDDDYEDLVAAAILALGYFCEASVHLRESGTDILELDVIATPSIGDPTPMVIEAKSGGTGISDVFKVHGWMNYTSIPEGRIVRRKAISAQHQPAYDAVGQHANITYRTFDPVQNPELSIIADPIVDLDTDVRKAAVSANWYGRVGQRLCQKALADYCKDCDDTTLKQAINSYRWAVHTSVFGGEPLARARTLYSAWKECPRLAAILVANDATLTSRAEGDVWEQVWTEGGRPAFERLLMIEHTARLRVVKYGLEQLLASGDSSLTWADLVTWELPASFQTGIERLQELDCRRSVPFLYQVFIELFGGFYRQGDDTDIALIASVAGIQQDEVIPALELLNDFFPTHDGWFITARDELVHMKMVPSTYRGTGCFFRRAAFGVNNYDELFPSMGWLLRRWHNALYTLLLPTLGAAS